MIDITGLISLQTIKFGRNNQVDNYGELGQSRFFEINYQTLQVSLEPLKLKKISFQNSFLGGTSVTGHFPVSIRPGTGKNKLNYNESKS